MVAPPPGFQVFRWRLGYLLPIEQPLIIAWHSTTLDHSAAKFIPQNIYMPMVGLLDLPGAEAIAFKLGLSGRETPLGQIAHSALSPLGGVVAARSGDLS